jgi:hypothetical protein
MILHILRSPVLWAGLVVVIAISISMLLINRDVQHNTPAPADLFMQSVIKRDGALGWHQLCSALQAQMPMEELASQVKKQRIAESQQGLTLSVDYIGAHAQSQGGQVRVYVVTARKPHGWVEQRTYIVYTQANGCVEDVKIS